MCIWRSLQVKTVWVFFFFNLRFKFIHFNAFRLYNVEGFLSESMVNGDLSVNNTLYSNVGIEKVLTKSIYNLEVNSFTVISSQFEEYQDTNTQNKNVNLVIAGTNNYLLFQTLTTSSKLKLNYPGDNIKLILDLNNFM